MAKRNRRQAEEPRRETRKEARIKATDRERDRKFYLGTAAVLGLIALVLIIGAIMEFVWEPRSSLVTVGGDDVSVGEFRKRASYERGQLVNQLFQYQQLERNFGLQGYFQNQISQIQTTLGSPGELGTQVLGQIIDEKIIVQQSAERGIEVTDEEIDSALREEVAALQGAVTIPQATSTAEAEVEATATAELWTPTPVPTVSISNTETLTPTATPEPAPTRPLLDSALYDTGVVTLTNNLKDSANYSLDEYRELIRVRLLDEKLAEVVIAEQDIPTTEEQVNARHILVRVIEPTPLPTEVPEGEEAPEPTEVPEDAPEPTPEPEPRDIDQAKELASELRQRIVDGEDFADIAAEYSDDLSNAGDGGNLDWFGRGMMVPEFEEAAFSLELNQVSEPVETDFGVHLIEVLEKDAERPRDEGEVEREQGNAYREWLGTLANDTVTNRPTDIEGMLPADLR